LHQGGVWTYDRLTVDTMSLYTMQVYAGTGGIVSPSSVTDSLSHPFSAMAIPAAYHVVGSPVWSLRAGGTVTVNAAAGSFRLFGPDTADAAFSWATPVAPTLYTPNQNDSNQATNLNLVWRSNTADSVYYLWYDTTLSFNSPFLVKDTLADTSKNVILGLTNSWYHWKVAAGNNGGTTSSFSSPRTFKTMSAYRRRHGGMNIGIGIGIGF
jgi:hypothetical protein